MSIKTLSAMMIGALVISAWTVSAGEGKGEGKQHKEKAAAAPVALQDIKVEGTLTKVEKAGKDGKASVHYELTDANGAKVRIPEQKGATVKLADFDGQKVVITGKGMTREGKNGKKETMVKEVISVEKAGAAAAAPAAAEPVKAVEKAL